MDFSSLAEGASHFPQWIGGIKTLAVGILITVGAKGHHNNRAIPGTELAQLEQSQAAVDSPQGKAQPGCGHLGQDSSAGNNAVDENRLAEKYFPLAVDLYRPRMSRFALLRNAQHMFASKADFAHMPGDFRIQVIDIFGIGDNRHSSTLTSVQCLFACAAENILVLFAAGQCCQLLTLLLNIAVHLAGGGFHIQAIA